MKSEVVVSDREQQTGSSGPSATQALDRVMRKTAIAVAGMGLMLAATQALAVPIYSGVVNLSAPATTNGLYLNVVTGANNLPTSTGGVTVPGWDINLWSTTGLGFFNPTAPTGGAYVISAVGFAANLVAGTVIDSGSSFGSGTSANTAQWNLNSSDNLFGFRFLNEADSQIYYGWGRIAIGATITSRTLVDYAYEGVAGASIAAGVGAVPEPATYGMMGMGIAALLLARRRRAG